MPTPSDVTRATQRLNVGDWLVDPALDRLERDGESIKLEPRTMRLLIALTSRPGELVTTEELLSTVWKDVLVTSSSIYEGVAQLRKALGDASDQPRYIATVPRKGYRLLAPVAPAQPVRSTSAVVAPSTHGEERAPPAGRALPDAGGRHRLAGTLATWIPLGLGTLVASAVFMLGPRPGAELIEPPAQAAALAFAGAEAPARAHRVLWVDDKPDNNLREREAMAAFNVRFDLALSTEAALQRLRGDSYDLIISDMNRPGDPSAGYTLLKSLRERGDTTRYMIYTSRCTDADMLEARSRGALGCAVQVSELMRAALGVMEARN